VLEEERTDVRWEGVSEEETTWRRLAVDGRLVFEGVVLYLLQIWKWKVTARKRKGLRTSIY
jgi:hypothetical protein